MLIISPLLISRAAGLFLIVLGTSVLIGWGLDITSLKSLLPGLITLKPNAALGFLLGGVSLYRLNSDKPSCLSSHLSLGCASLVLLLGVITLSEYAFDLNIGIDDLLVQVPAGESYNNLHPARMNPVSAQIFSLTACALLLLQERRTSAIAQYLAMALTLFSLFNLFGFLFAWDSTAFVLSYKPVSIYAGIGFLVVSVGLLAATMEFGVLATIRHKLTGIALSMAISLLLLAIYASFINIENASATASRLEKINDVLWRVEKVAGDIELNIAAYRGFVLSGDDKFIAPLPASRQRLQENLDVIKGLIADSSQADEIPRLEALIASRIKMCDEKIQLRREQGMVAAAQAVAKGQGEELNRQIRAGMDALIQAELNLGSQFKTRTQINQNNAFIALWVTFFFGLGLILSVLAGLRRQINQRVLADSEREKSLQYLEESELRYRLLSERQSKIASRLPGMIYQYKLHPDGSSCFPYASEAINAIYGVTSESVLNNAAGVFKVIHPEDFAGVVASIRTSAETLLPWKYEYRTQNAVSSVHWLLGNAVPEREADGAIIWHGYITDITERKAAEDELQLYRQQLEAIVKNRTVELEAVNQELEAFAYSVSHDLRAPLRSIDGFCQALMEDYANNLDSTGCDYLNRVRAASQRMGVLIDDLLKLSRITRASLKHYPVDLSLLARTVFEQLHEAYPEHQVEFVLKSDLQTEGDPGLLKIALENLLGNAWKYSAKKARPSIEFGSIEEKNATVYFVSDNGAGFDMNYVDKLFGAFQRLHHRDQFEGVGIGLATVKRIIHRHGGTIWAESEMDKKTTFYFTLPKQVPETKHILIGG